MKRATHRNVLSCLVLLATACSASVDRLEAAAGGGDGIAIVSAARPAIATADRVPVAAARGVAVEGPSVALLAATPAVAPGPGSAPGRDAVAARATRHRASPRARRTEDRARTLRILYRRLP